MELIDPTVATNKAKKSKKQKFPIRLIISFYSEPSNADTEEEVKRTVEEDTASISDDSLYTHISEGMDKEDLETSSYCSLKERRGKRKKKGEESSAGQKSTERSRDNKMAESTAQIDEPIQATTCHLSKSSDGTTGLRSMVSKLQEERSFWHKRMENVTTKLECSIKLLERERRKSGKLKARIIELEKEIFDDEPSWDTESNELALRIKMLETENEILKQKTERQAKFIVTLIADQQSKTNQGSRGGSTASLSTMMPSTTTVQLD